MEFCVDFGAEDVARLAPCKDDKPKYTEITLFQAGSDYLFLAKQSDCDEAVAVIFRKAPFDRRGLLICIKLIGDDVRPQMSQIMYVPKYQ